MAMVVVQEWKAALLDVCGHCNCGGGIWSLLAPSFGCVTQGLPWPVPGCSWESPDQLILEFIPRGLQVQSLLWSVGRDGPLKLLGGPCFFIL